MTRTKKSYRNLQKVDRNAKIIELVRLIPPSMLVHLLLEFIDTAHLDDILSRVKRKENST